MSSIPTKSRDKDLLVVPAGLQSQLSEFRGRVWTTKMLEALAFAVAAVLLAFLTVYLFDRIWDTPQIARVFLFFGALAAWVAIPYALHRWVWRHRRFDQLARLLRVREPSVGDQLLSVIELAENESEQSRSRTLCAAAIAQVAESASHRDLTQAAPSTRLRMWTSVLGIAALVVAWLAFAFPAASSNAWARFTAPWKNTPRYTFTALKPVADRIVVAHGEEAELLVRLDDASQWQPNQATMQFEGLPSPLTADLEDGVYRFTLPPQLAEVTTKLVVGDYYQSVTLEPKTRPELVGAMAQVRLPDYLQRPEPVQFDVRSGTLAAVQGSQAVINATASRDLDHASINDQAVTVQEASFNTTNLELAEEESKLSMIWRDHDGLEGKEPFEVTVNPSVDEVPTVLSQDFPRQAVVMDSEQINFQALAADDFGVKKIGISWTGLDDTLAEPVVGEKLIAAGDPNRTSMQVPATFTASKLGIDPQPIEVRLWVEDYLPNRERVYSAPHVLFVLTPEQHAIWITDQLSKWHRASLDVRDTELQLFESNKRLQTMSADELSSDEMRGEIRRQASLENANGRRLSSLAKKGELLLRQAARNPEIGVGHLDRWAEMLQILNDIGNERMPSVAELLTKASQQPGGGRGKPGSGQPSAAGQGQPGQGQPGEGQPGQGEGGQPSNDQLASDSGGQSDDQKEQMPRAGQNRDNRSGGPGKPQPKADDFVNAKQVPKISDMESSMHPNEPQEEDDDSEPVEKVGNGSRLTLPSTTITGPAGKKPPGGKPQQKKKDSDEPLEEALFEQEELLAEFEKISDELNTVLANLEGSTLVKRLKAASREQDQVAQKIGTRISSVFGNVSNVNEEDKTVLVSLSNVEEKSSQSVSYIMDDMQAYYERRRMNQFKLVLDEMKESEVLTALRKLGDEIPSKHGMSIAQAEYWSDTMDRWADDLVDPACSGQCPGSKTSEALPPSLILAVLKALESEVNLREETRVVEQARPGLVAKEHQVDSGRLSESQSEIKTQVDDVVTAIRDLPKGEDRFAKEIDLLTQVSEVMSEASKILASSETGTPAIAAETEAIELLLACKRINPKGGGGGGASPGGGGKGETQDSALALLGSGLNQNERREARDVTQATGETGRVLPEEFRGGLDKYFEQIEQEL